MRRNLTMVILASLILCSFFSSDIIAKTFEKPTPTKIPPDQIVPSSPTSLTGDKGFCLIQSDDGTTAYYMPTLVAGQRIAIYMDPTTCGVQNPYPFKVTDVHFYLDNFGGAVWPVEIRVNIRDLFQANKCNGPESLLCSQTYTIPVDSAYPVMIHLDLDSLCFVYAPFFLEIEYTGGTSSPYPSPLITDGITNPTDTCDVWLFWEGSYREWLGFYGSGIGYPILRATGYTNSTSVEEEETGITPKDFALYQSYPNPFNNQTIIKYDLLKPCQVTLTIYNILGQKVKTVVEGYQRAGSRIVNWDGKDEKEKDLASGIYFYQLKAGDLTQTKRMTLLK
jgi:hypothetical protein